MQSIQKSQKSRHRISKETKHTAYMVGVFLVLGSLLTLTACSNRNDNKVPVEKVDPSAQPTVEELQAQLAAANAKTNEALAKADEFKAQVETTGMVPQSDYDAIKTSLEAAQSENEDLKAQASATPQTVTAVDEEPIDNSGESTEAPAADENKDKESDVVAETQQKADDNQEEIIEAAGDLRALTMAWDENTLEANKWLACVTQNQPVKVMLKEGENGCGEAAEYMIDAEKANKKVVCLPSLAAEGDTLAIPLIDTLSTQPLELTAGCVDGRSVYFEVKDGQLMIVESCTKEFTQDKEAIADPVKIKECVQQAESSVIGEKEPGDKGEDISKDQAGETPAPEEGDEVVGGETPQETPKEETQTPVAENNEEQEEALYYFSVTGEASSEAHAAIYGTMVNGTSIWSASRRDGANSNAEDFAHVYLVKSTDAVLNKIQNDILQIEGVLDSVLISKHRVEKILVDFYVNTWIRRKGIARSSGIAGTFLGKHKEYARFQGEILASDLKKEDFSEGGVLAQSPFTGTGFNCSFLNNDCWVKIYNRFPQIARTNKDGIAPDEDGLSPVQKLTQIIDKSLGNIAGREKLNWWSLNDGKTIKDMWIESRFWILTGVDEHEQKYDPVNKGLSAKYLEVVKEKKNLPVGHYVMKVSGNEVFRLLPIRSDRVHIEYRYKYNESGKAIGVGDEEERILLNNMTNFFDSNRKCLRAISDEKGIDQNCQ